MSQHFVDRRRFATSSEFLGATARLYLVVNILQATILDSLGVPFWATNLVILLTPYIIRDQRDLQAIQQRKLREHQEFARSFAELEHMTYEARIDYGKKRGLLEDINRAVLDVEQDQAGRAAITGAGPRGVEAGSVDIHPPTAP